jgi:uncharacterized protein (DUF1015 family)
MAEIAPFRGILYKPGPTASNDVSALIAPPYDVISERERKELAARSPHNSVQLILPQDRPGRGTDDRYQVAAETLRDFLHTGVMARDEQPALYRYHQIFTPPGEASAPPVVRRGFICRVRLHRFSEGIILPHERTLAGPKADRLKLKRATRTHLSQVFGLYDDPQREADAAFEELEREEPALQGKTSDGVTHRLWRLTDPAAVAAVQRVLAGRSIYIADGHHRYETMLALRDELRREPGYCGENSAVEYGSIFLCNVADPGLLVFPTHRVLHSLPGFSLDALLAKLAAHFRIEEAAPPASGAEVRRELQQRGAGGPSFLVVSGGRAVYLTLRPGADLSVLSGPAVLRTLDVTLLHALVLEQALGIDRAAQEAQTYLRYIKDNEQALQAARAPDVQAVFLMNPTPVAQVMACSDAGEVMPQKSTYFYPKIASGLVLNPLDPAESVPAGAA